ncbi:hypothetical protein ANO11243_042250 [Dothideomycetidae sp. 11243]|nr:hypothetical protein ANO11243_042250 [fungal sp. No.11243]
MVFLNTCHLLLILLSVINARDGAASAINPPPPVSWEKPPKLPSATPPKAQSHFWVQRAYDQVLGHEGVQGIQDAERVARQGLRAVGLSGVRVLVDHPTFGPCVTVAEGRQFERVMRIHHFPAFGAPGKAQLDPNRQDKWSTNHNSGRNRVPLPAADRGPQF